MMFSFQISINSNAKIFDKIIGVEMFSSKLNRNSTASFILWYLKIINSGFRTFREIFFAFNQ